LRDVDAFIHKDFRARSDIRYIKRTLDTRLSKTRVRNTGKRHPTGRLHPDGHPFR